MIMEDKDIYIIKLSAENVDGPVAIRGQELCTAQFPKLRDSMTVKQAPSDPDKWTWDTPYALYMEGHVTGDPTEKLKKLIDGLEKLNFTKILVKAEKILTETVFEYGDKPNVLEIHMINEDGSTTDLTEIMAPVIEGHGLPGFPHRTKK